MSFNKKSRTPDLKNIPNVFKIHNQDDAVISISKPILLDK